MTTEELIERWGLDPESVEEEYQKLMQYCRDYRHEQRRLWCKKALHWLWPFEHKNQVINHSGIVTRPAVG